MWNTLRGMCSYSPRLTLSASLSCLEVLVGAQGLTRTTHSQLSTSPTRSPRPRASPDGPPSPSATCSSPARASSRTPRATRSSRRACRPSSRARSRCASFLFPFLDLRLPPAATATDASFLLVVCSSGRPSSCRARTARSTRPAATSPTPSTSGSCTARRRSSCPSRSTPRGTWTTSSSRCNPSWTTSRARRTRASRRTRSSTASTRRPCTARCSTGHKTVSRASSALSIGVLPLFVPWLTRRLAVAQDHLRRWRRTRTACRRVPASRRAVTAPHFAHGRREEPGRVRHVRPLLLALGRSPRGRLG